MAARDDLPVQQPERRRVFEIRVEPFVAEDRLAERAGPEAAARPARLAGDLRDDASGEAPMADRADHVLADAEQGHGVVAAEESDVGGHAVHALLEPGVAKREGFVAGEAQAYRRGLHKLAARRYTHRQQDNRHSLCREESFRRNAANCSRNW